MEQSTGSVTNLSRTSGSKVTLVEHSGSTLNIQASTSVLSTSRHKSSAVSAGSRKSTSSHGRKSTLSKPLTRRVVLDPTPEKAVRQYFEDKFEERLVKKKPEWDVPRLTPATELLAARRELSEVEKSLEHKRSEYDVKKKELDKMWGNLRARQQDLKESFIKYDKFIKENEVKKTRALRKAEEERQTQKEKDEEIAVLKERVAQLTRVKENLLMKVQEYKIYEDFLDRVLKETDEFEELREILTRYETLASTRQELSERQQKNLEEIEEERGKMLKMTEEKMYDMMVLNSQLQELQQRHKTILSQTYRWEGHLNKIKNSVADKTLELGQIRLACYNLYTQVCRFKEVKPTLPVNDVGPQLDYIEKSILDLNTLLHSIKEAEAKELPSSNKATVSSTAAKAKVK